MLCARFCVNVCCVPVPACTPVTGNCFGALLQTSHTAPMRGSGGGTCADKHPPPAPGLCGSCFGPWRTLKTPSVHHAAHGRLQAPSPDLSDAQTAPPALQRQRTQPERKQASQPTQPRTAPRPQQRPALGAAGDGAEDVLEEQEGGAGQDGVPKVLPGMVYERGGVLEESAPEDEDEVSGGYRGC